MKITVFMAIANHEKVIEKTIESIMGQSMDDFELIIFNTLSTDKTIELVNSFKDHRIKYQPQCINAVEVLKNTLKISTGKYLLMHNPYELMHPSLLEKLLIPLKNDKIIASYAFTNLTNDIPVNLPMSQIDHKIHILNTPLTNFEPFLISKKAILKNKLNYNKAYFLAPHYKLLFDLIDCGQFEVVADRLVNIRMTQERLDFFGNPLTQSIYSKIKQEELSKLLKVYDINYTPQSITSNNQYETYVEKIEKIENDYLAKTAKNIVKAELNLSFVQNIKNWIHS